MKSGKTNAEVKVNASRHMSGPVGRSMNVRPASRRGKKRLKPTHPAGKTPHSNKAIRRMRLSGVSAAHSA